MLHDDAEARRVAQLDQRSSEMVAVPAPVEVPGDRFPELEQLSREALGDRGPLTLAPVVEGQAEAAILQGSHVPGGRARAVHRRGRVHLEHEPVTRGRAGAEQPVDPQDEVGVPQRVRREVHRHPGRLAVRRRADGPAQDRCQHPLVQRAAQLRRPHRREEGARRQQAAARMSPPDQRLETGERPLRHAQDRLVVQHELVSLEGLAQVGLELLHLHVRFRPGSRRGREEADACRALGRVHGPVGGAQQRGEVGRVVRKQGHADARPDPERLLAHLDRQFGRLGEPSSRRDRALAILDLRQQHGELVAPYPGRHVAAARLGLESLGHGHQHAVAGLVAQGVVDPLEAGQVEIGDRGPRGVSVRQGEEPFGVGFQEPPVRQARERVGEGHASQLVRQPLLLADVDQGAHHDRCRPIRIRQQGAALEHRHVVARAVAELHLPARELPELAERLVAVVQVGRRAVELRDRAADQPVGRLVAEGPRES